jgi:HEPN domain-containing protein
MADDDKAERIFLQAIRFHHAQKLVMESSPNDQREALVQPVCVLAAFTIELLLKCLIRIEGGTPPRDHDLLELFNLLSASTRERLEAMWRHYVQSQRAETTEPFEQIGTTIEPELTSALAAGRKGFEVVRYWHEEPQEDCVFYLTELPNMLFEVAFELRPDWAQPPR